MKLRFCCAIKDSQLLFIELIIRTHIEKHSVGLSPLNFLFLARSPNEKWFAIEITRKYEKLSQRAYNKFKTNLKLLSVEGRLLPDKMESSTAALGMVARRPLWEWWHVEDNFICPGLNSFIKILPRHRI